MQVNMYACSESIFHRIWVLTNTFPVSARPAFIIFVNSDASGGRLTLIRWRHSFTPSWRRVSIIAMQSSPRLRRTQQTGYRVINAFWFCWTRSYTGWTFPNGYDTIRYDSVCLTCSKKLTCSQLSLPHGTNKKLKCKTKNKMMSMIGPVQSRYREAVQ